MKSLEGTLPWDDLHPLGEASAARPAHSLLKYPFQRRRRDMSIDSPIKQSASSVGAACPGNPASMPLLRSFGHWAGGFYKHVAPMALRDCEKRPGGCRAKAQRRKGSPRALTLLCDFATLREILFTQSLRLGSRTRRVFQQAAKLTHSSVQVSVHKWFLRPLSLSSSFTHPSSP